MKVPEEIFIHGLDGKWHESSTPAKAQIRYIREDVVRTKISQAIVLTDSLDDLTSRLMQILQE